MKVGSGGNLGLSREYPKKLFGPIVLFMVELSFKRWKGLKCDFLVLAEGETASKGSSLKTQSTRTGGSRSSLQGAPQKRGVTFKAGLIEDRGETVFCGPLLNMEQVNQHPNTPRAQR